MIAVRLTPNTPSPRLSFPSATPAPALRLRAWRNPAQAALLLLTCTLAVLGQAAPLPQLQVLRPSDQSWVRLDLPGEADTVYTVEGSTNLIAWREVAITHEGISRLPDPASSLLQHRFYRVGVKARTDADDWKNQAHYPGDAFTSSPGNVIGPDVQWIKFTIPLAEPFRVFYQDSRPYDFHIDFVRKRLEGFGDITPVQFEQIALRTNQQQLLVGALLVPPYPTDSEYGIQFAGADAYPPEMVGRYFELVKATVAAPAEVVAFYVPAFEQAHAAELNRGYFESNGVPLASVERWISGDNVYSTGWTLGHLKFFPGTEINAAFSDGRLRPDDILLTDGVPAEVPVLAGILTLTPSTPNSHVAILAKTFGLPFAYVSDPAERVRLQQLVGKDVFLRVDPFSMQVKTLELESSLPPALREEILSLKSPLVLNIQPKTQFGALSAPTDNLHPNDIKYFGGKAANFGFLRRAVPANSPEAIAFSFDLWDEFMSQVLPSGRTLRAEIAERLSGYTYPPRVADLKADLAAIRNLITRTAQFSPAQKSNILSAVSGFSKTRKVRFRSSTNVEDTEQFTGAGLYDSFSGCIGDDEDDNELGPCQCDPTEPNERGVFRALRKVYASFYNDNAFLERLRYNVDESTVGMAVLVHYSTPDETELANGVATMQVQRGTGTADSMTGDLVTQKGAVSITNPDGSARPEVLQGYLHAFGAGGFLKQRSSLVPLGAHVMQWDADYIQLLNLLGKVADGYYAYRPEKKQFTLDFEYKKVTPNFLQVKQVREVPLHQATNNLPSFLVHEPNEYVVFQGEAADVFSNHRLKSMWQFHTRNMKLVASNLAASVFTEVQSDYLEGGKLQHLGGAPDALPNAAHFVQGEYAVDSWSTGQGAARRDFQLRTEIRREVSPTQAPVLTLADLRVELGATYATPQPALHMDFDGLKETLVTNHYVVLQPRPTLASTNRLQQRSATAGGVKVDVSFYWPTYVGGRIIEKTAPLAQWKETRIEGLTSEPIVLHGEFSQTYRPGHHNFTEEFIFEPALEPDLPPGILAELQARNVQLIHLLLGFQGTELRILGLDGKFRKLGSDPAAGKKTALDLG